MSVLRQNSTPARHRWIDVFLAKPKEEFANFLAGYARIEPFDRAESPDAARMLFGPLGSDDVARRTLDETVRAWLEEQRREGIPDTEMRHLHRKLGEIADAIRIVSVLSLQQTSADFRKRFVLWMSWVERLAEIPGPDVLAGFLSAVALTQRLVHRTKTDINPFGLEPLWFRVCEQAGSRYPTEYMPIGLLGLRMLPERKHVPSERPWMAGLARWATVQKPKLEDFCREWWALRTLYQPTTPGYWREMLAETLRQKNVTGIPENLRTFWEQDVGFGKAGARAERRGDPKNSLLPPPSIRNSLLDRIGAPVDVIRPEVGNLIAQYERYAEATGDSYFVVRSATNIGMRLIESGNSDELVERGHLAIELARKALEWVPTHAHAWALWRDVLELLGNYEDAELVGWDAIRRLPEVPELRNQLARLLLRFPNRKDDTERLLRETHKRFPQDKFAINQLAGFLISHPSRANLDEAEGLLRKELSHDSEDNDVSSIQLAHLLAERPERKYQNEAETLLRGMLRRNPNNSIASNQLARLLGRRPERGFQDEAVSLLRGVLNRNPDDDFASHQLAGLLARRPERESRAEAEGLFRGVLNRNPDDNIAGFLLARLLVKRPERESQDEAEALLRGVLNRNPDDNIAGNLLAGLLVKRPERESQDEAEALLRSVLNRNSNDKIASGQLKGLLVKNPERKDQEEAEATLPEKRKGSAGDVVANNEPPLPLPDGVEQKDKEGSANSPAELPDRLRDANGGILPASTEAERTELQLEIDRVLEQSISDSIEEVLAKGNFTTSMPSTRDEKAKSTEASVETFAAPKLRSTRAKRVDDDLSMTMIRCGGRLRRIATDLPHKKNDERWRRSALQEIESVIAEDGNFAYVQFLKDELTESSAAVPSAGTFALAFIDSIRSADSERLRDIELNQPVHSRLFDVARTVLFKDLLAANRVVQWLNVPDDAEPRSAAVLRGFFKQRFGVQIAENDKSVISDISGFILRVAANDNIRLDLIESALAPADFPLAA